MSILSGSFPVIPTPFDDDGEIVESDFRSLVDFVVACGSDGCVFPGVASEVETLSGSERARLIRLLGECLNGRIPFIVGASDPDPEEAAERVLEGARAGASAAMIMAPKHLGDSVDEHVAFFSSIGRNGDLPIMLQNAPIPIGAGLAPEAVAEMARKVEQIEYVKEETMPCGQNLTRIRAAAGGALNGVFGGAGGRYVVDELARGSLGTMPASELADIHALLVKAWQNEEQLEARRLFNLSLPALNFQAVFRMAMTKEVLKRRGVIKATGLRAGGPRLDEGDRQELTLLLEDVAKELICFPIS